MKALEQIPNYVKFIKDILSKKKILSAYETVALIKEYNAFLQNKLPPKLKELRSSLYRVTSENLTVVKLCAT